MIEESKQSQSSATRELQALEQQITLRNRLIRNLNAEVREMEDETQRRHQEIDDLETSIQQLKDEYAQMIYQAYKNRNSYDKLMYIFAAEDFNQAFMRLKLMQRYGEVRGQHKEEIERKRLALEERIQSLETLREERVSLLDSKSNEKAQLAEDRSTREQKLNQLKSKESELRKTQQQQESERQRINRAIQLKIEEELRADRNREGGSFGLTPEGLIISENFEKNKGKLPWPVTRGVILQKFGQQPHAYLPGITVMNNGVDIATDAGMKVRAIFDGTVSSVFAIPGAGQNVIVTHGSYKTVYTNLASVAVRKGDQVTAFQELGKLVTQDGSSTAHLEIWKVNSSGGDPQNPEYWISK
jgi:septal ring factor EnvC (AmiA/AmiB activator)